MLKQLCAREAYRPFFLVFPLIGAAALAGWVGGLRGHLALGPTDHAAAMIWGVLGLAVLGFLGTAYPRQNDAAPPSPALLSGALALALATTLAWAAAWMGAPTRGLVAALGATLWAGVWVWATRIAWGTLRRRWDGTTAAVPLALGAGLAGWIEVGWGSDPRLGVALGLHPFLIGLALALLDRLLPFFCSKAVPGYSGTRKPGFAVSLLPLLLLRALAWGPIALWDAALLLLLIRQAVGWRIDQGLRTPMVAVLILGVGWLGLGYAAELVLGPGPAPTHLWTVGGLGTLVLGISTRVTRGHGGLPVALDRWTGLALALLQAATLLRVVPALTGAQGLGTWSAAAAALGLAWTIWWVRHARLLTRSGA